ncbi:hypothetical protein [Rossellomorea sp. BNER]|uniref:hypothetical protein n=1 Tax=Rossellomorea sp. BNER TaxID=2962031 RepID=UPI003AF1F4EE|nr:hypothetical protein [Rossellomorea sp. BNER]
MYDQRQTFNFPFPPSGGNQGFPGFPSFPGGGGDNQGFPSFPPPGQSGGGSNQGPPGPPPSFEPSLSAQGPSTFAVDPGAIQGCLFRFTYIWLRGRESFWFFPIFVGRRSIAGWRWIGFRWVYFGVDLNRIQSFQCF